MLRIFEPINFGRTFDMENSLNIFPDEFSSKSLRRFSPYMKNLKCQMNDFKWTDDTKWQKRMQLSKNCRDPDIKIRVENEVLAINVTSSTCYEKNGVKSETIQKFQSSFQLPKTTVKIHSKQILKMEF